MRVWILLFILICSNARADYATIAPALRGAAAQEINVAIETHYQSLSANEKWGVGMRCTLGRMQRLVKEAKVIRLDSDAGKILVDSGIQQRLFFGETRSQIVISFIPNTDQILTVRVFDFSSDRKRRVCSTRDKLFNF